MINDSKDDGLKSNSANSEMTDLKISLAESELKQFNSSGESSVVSDHSDSEQQQMPKEVNGPKGLEPTRYGDWEAKGRCFDF